MAKDQVIEVDSCARVSKDEIKNIIKKVTGQEYTVSIERNKITLKREPPKSQPTGTKTKDNKDGTIPEESKEQKDLQQSDARQPENNLLSSEDREKIDAMISQLSDRRRSESSLFWTKYTGIAGVAISLIGFLYANIELGAISKQIESTSAQIKSTNKQVESTSSHAESLSKSITNLVNEGKKINAKLEDLRDSQIWQPHANPIQPFGSVYRRFSDFLRVARILKESSVPPMIKNAWTEEAYLARRNLESSLAYAIYYVDPNTKKNVLVSSRNRLAARYKIKEVPLLSLYDETLRKIALSVDVPSHVDEKWRRMIDQPLHSPDWPGSPVGPREKGNPLFVDGKSNAAIDNGSEKLKGDLEMFRKAFEDLEDVQRAAMAHPEEWGRLHGK